MHGVACILLAIALSASNGCGPAARPSPAPAAAQRPVTPAPDGRRAKATANLRAYADRQRELPAFAETYDGRATELARARPTAAQCTYVPTVIAGYAPDEVACPPSDRRCARPADNLSSTTPKPTTPMFDHGCPRYPTRPAADIGPDLHAMSSDDGARLEGCIAAMQLWLLTACP